MVMLNRVALVVVEDTGHRSPSIHGVQILSLIHICADFADLAIEDIKAVSQEDSAHPIEARLLSADNEINALVLSRTPYCFQAAKRGIPLIAALDDLAQIVGYQIRTCAYTEKAVAEALKEATGCFIKGKGVTITTGRDLYEACLLYTSRCV